MSSFTASASTKPCATRAFTAQRPVSGRISTVQHQHKALSLSRQQLSRCPGHELSRSSSRRTTKTCAVQELCQVADVGSFVGGTAATMFAMTLVGLAIGFVLLRFEALVEEGKI